MDNLGKFQYSYNLFKTFLTVLVPLTGQVLQILHSFPQIDYFPKTMRFSGLFKFFILFKPGCLTRKFVGIFYIVSIGLRCGTGYEPFICPLLGTLDQNWGDTLVSPWPYTGFTFNSSLVVRKLRYRSKQLWLKVKSWMPGTDKLQ